MWLVGAGGGRGRAWIQHDDEASVQSRSTGPRPASCRRHVPELSQRFTRCWAPSCNLTLGAAFLAPFANAATKSKVYLLSVPCSPPSSSAGQPASTSGSLTRGGRAPLAGPRPIWALTCWLVARYCSIEAPSIRAGRLCDAGPGWPFSGPAARRSLRRSRSPGRGGHKFLKRAVPGTATYTDRGHLDVVLPGPAG